MVSTVGRRVTGSRWRGRCVSLVGRLAVLASLVAGTAQAQPQSAPLVQQGDLRYLGRFTLPTTDGTGRPDAEGGLTWGGKGLGMGPDGTSLYFGCHDHGKRLARVTIPALGGVGRIVEPCAPIVTLTAINPAGGSPQLGGSLAWNGRVAVSAYTYYDADNRATASHFVGTNVSTQAGPYRLSAAAPGLVAGYMAIVPPEWRALLGGPALTGQCCIPIIGRSSYGPSASVFNPDDLGVVNPVPSTMLVGYPDAHQTLGPWGTYNPNFTGATVMGGIAFPVGTRSVLFIGRHGGTWCYGTGTTNPALAGTPDGTGTTYCYDPSSTGVRGTYGYPYQHQVWAYDANDLVAVKQGTKQPWDVRPYGVWTLTEMNNRGTANITSATYDPATRRIYVSTPSGDGPPLIHVYEVQTGSAPPPPPPPPPPPAPPTATLVATPAALTHGETAHLCWTTTHATSATVTPDPGLVSPVSGGCVDVTPAATTTYALVAPGAGGSATATATIVVTVPPPPPVPRWTGMVRAQTAYTSGGVVAGVRLALQVPDAAVSLVPPVGASASLLVPLTDGTTDRRTCTVHKIELTGYATPGARPRVTLQCRGLTGVSVAVEP